MRLGIKSKQVIGVTSIVAAVVVALSLVHLARLAQVSLEESQARAELLGNAVYHRARDLVGQGADPARAFATDPGLRAILESSLYSKNVTFAAIADVNGIVVAGSDRAEEGTPLPPGADLAALMSKSALSELLFIYSGQGRTLEYRQRLLLGDREFGSIRVGVSTLLVRRDLDRSLTPAIATALIALTLAVVIAVVLAQRLLRPIHVIRSGLTRLGRGEFGVQLDLDRDDEFGELGTDFNAVSDRLAADALAPLDPAAREQAALGYARKLAALNRLSAGVAHEIKNPLNAMMIHLELLRQHLGSAGGADADRREAVQHVDVIAGAIRRLDEAVQGFLKFSRPEELHLRPVNLAALVAEIVPVVESEAEGAGVRLVVDCGRAPDVNADPAMLRQAFHNLALNACQAMPDGGTLQIVGAAARGRRASISFIDTGVGIAPEHLQKIFDLYFTTKEKGSGIGLSMAYRTVQMHDGEIEVESTPGGGSTFRVLLPQV